MNIKNEALKQIWSDRYKKNNETIEDNIRRVAKYCSNNTEQEQKFFHIMNNGLFFPAGRTMSNAGVGKDLTLNNCFNLNFVEDSIDDIFDKVKMGAKTHKRGGGTGYEYSKIRPNGSPTSNEAIASGVVSFLHVFDTQTATIMSGGRRGANMAVLSVYHPDIFEYINAKSYDKGILTHFNLSVMVDDDFMKALENNDDIFLHYPIYDDNGFMIKDESKWQYKKKIKAQKIWDMIIQKAYDNGEPGILFYDNMNKDNNTYYVENVINTNPCVSGDTLVLTNTGYKKIDQLINQRVNIWNGYEYSEVEPKITGYNQDMMQITFSNGISLKCTPYHKFILKGNKRIEAKNLSINDKLEKFNFPIIQGYKKLEEKYAYTKGFFSGDGTEKNKKTNYNIIPLYGVKKQLINYEVINNEYDIETRLNWLAGLIDAGGTLQSNDGGISISSINKQFLSDVQLMLHTLGVHSTVSLMQEERKKMLPDGNSNYKEYSCKAAYRLLINCFYVKKLMDLGLSTKRVSLIANPNRNASRFLTIKEVKFLQEKEKIVYCFNELKNHSGIFNGIMTAQCGEYISGILFQELLNKYLKIQNAKSSDFKGACNLGSLFLHNFIKNPFTSNAYVDLFKLEKTIYTAVEMLDNIIDVNKFPLKDFENYQKSLRTIGLGITGFADALIMLNIRYGNKESIEFADSIMNFIAKNVYKASIKLAKTKGDFPLLDREKFIQSGYITKHIEKDLEWKEIANDILKYGIRNARLLSIAPVGTISLTFGNNCSSGCEPIFRLEYDRKVKVGGQDDSNIQTITIKDYAYDLWQNTKQNNIVNENVFATTNNLSVDEHLNVLHAIAFHVDMSCSKTINLPTDYSFKDTKDIYYKAWKCGIKGCTIFRPNELRQGILIDKNVSTSKNNDLIRGEWQSIMDDTIYYPRKVYIGCGKLKLMIGWSEKTQKIQDLYVIRSAQGGCERNLQAMVIAMSGMLRLGGDIFNIEKAFKGLGSCNSFVAKKVKNDKLSMGGSCGSAILYEIKQILKEIKNQKKILEVQQISNEELNYKEQYGEIAFAKQYNKCPDCFKKIEHIEGCITCHSCGWTKC